MSSTEQVAPGKLVRDKLSSHEEDLMVEHLHSLVGCQVLRKTQVAPSGRFLVARTNLGHSYMARKGRRGTGGLLERKGCPCMWETAKKKTCALGFL